MNWNIKNFTGIIFLGISILFIQCGEDDEEFPLDGTILSMDEISGNWEATMVEFSSAAAGPVQTVEIIGAGGSFTLTIQTNGRFTMNLSIPGTTTEITGGQLGFDEELLVVIYDEDPDEWEYFGIMLNNDELLLTGPGTFDFDGDNIDESAFVALELERN